MVDPYTKLALVGSLLASKDIIIKVLGPTADYIGESLRNVVGKSADNLGSIFDNAHKKLGDKAEKTGAVPPRVLKGVLTEGVFCDDSLTAEYFGGVLASSKSEISRDDRGVYFNALISRLSTYQIRSHYVFYRILKNLYDGNDLNIGTDSMRMTFFVPIIVYVKALDFVEDEEKEKFSVLLDHAMVGLHNEGLCKYSMGSKAHLQKQHKTISEDGIIFHPTCLGIELFHWVHGRSDLAPISFLDIANQFEIDIEIEISPGSLKL